jgi:hypothetical protein
LFDTVPSHLHSLDTTAAAAAAAQRTKFDAPLSPGEIAHTQKKGKPVGEEESEMLNF